VPFCAYCGKEVSAQAPYCPNCGHPQNTGSAAPGATAVMAPAKQTEGLAIASLVLGIASFLIIPIIPAILAIVFGRRARHLIRESGKEGRAMALAGEIIGWVHIGLVVLVVLFIVLFLVAWDHGSVVHVSPQVRLSF
jgi:MFS family permease